MNNTSSSKTVTNARIAVIGLDDVGLLLAIENAQRDVNISFVNEPALIFKCMGIDNHGVIEVVGAKWDFLKYKPGLADSHCIGVYPYHLARKAQSLSYHRVGRSW